MLKKLVAGAVLLQASLGVDCDSLNEDQKCQDPLKPCLDTISNLCAPENGPGCSGGSELIYCPAIAVRDSIGRCGFKGCHEGSCVHNDPNIGACYPAKNDSTCHIGSTKCVTLAPTSSPITSIVLKKCAIGISNDGWYTTKLYTIDLNDGSRYEWSDTNFGYSYRQVATATALNSNTDIIYTYINPDRRLVGYHLYTKEKVLNKRIRGRLVIKGMDFNENDGHIYAASFEYCYDYKKCKGNLYKLTTAGEFVVTHHDIVPEETTGFIFSKNYNDVYYITYDDKLYKSSMDNLNVITPLPYLNSWQGNPDSMDWYTNDPNDPTLLICVTERTPECWTYNVETFQSSQLWNAVYTSTSYYSPTYPYYLSGIEVLNDEYEDCQNIFDTCPVKIKIEKSSECGVVIKVLSSDCACIDEIEYFELLPSNMSPIQLTQPSWEEVDGQYWSFNSCVDSFEGPFGVKIGKTGKVLYQSNVFDLNDKIMYQFQDNFCQVL